MARRKKRTGRGGLELYKLPVFTKKKKLKEERFSERQEEREEEKPPK